MTWANKYERFSKPYRFTITLTDSSRRWFRSGNHYIIKFETYHLLGSRKRQQPFYQIMKRDRKLWSSNQALARRAWVVDKSGYWKTSDFEVWISQRREDRAHDNWNTLPEVFKAHVYSQHQGCLEGQHKCHFLFWMYRGKRNYSSLLDPSVFQSTFLLDPSDWTRLPSLLWIAFVKAIFWFDTYDCSNEKAVADFVRKINNLSHCWELLSRRSCI